MEDLVFKGSYSTEVASDSASVKGNIIGGNSAVDGGVYRVLQNQSNMQ